MATEIDAQPHIVSATSVESELTLNPERLYSIYHTGKDLSGSASTNEVFAQCDGTAVEATYAVKEGKIAIQSGLSYPIPPGATSVKLKTTSDTVALQVLASEVPEGGVK